MATAKPAAKAAAKPAVKKAKARKKEKKNIAFGHAHIKSTFNNTMLLRLLSCCLSSKTCSEWGRLT